MIISNFLKSVYEKDVLLFRLGLFHFIIFALLFLPLAIDDRLIEGINPWIKPMKFSLSIGIYAWTIAWYLSYLKPLTSWTKVINITIAASMMIEIIIVLLQAGRGVQSHFNNSTALDGALFGTMGMMIALSSLATAILLILLFVKKPNLDFVYLTSLRLGIVILLVASGIGGMMIGNNAHAIGVEDGGAGLPFVNWSTEGGDLRIAHFLGLHSLQIFPLFTFWVKKRFNISDRGRLYILLVFTLLFGLLLNSLFRQAMDGIPLVRV